MASVIANPPETIERRWFVADVAAFISCSHSQVHRLTDEGLPFYRLSPKGRSKRFDPTEVKAWWDSRKVVKEVASKREAKPLLGATPGGPKASGAMSPAEVKAAIKASMKTPSVA